MPIECPVRKPTIYRSLNCLEAIQDYLRRDNGELSSFWMSYVDIVETILLTLLCAIRECNWQLQFSAIQALILWCFAYHKLKYACYLPVYYAQMKNITTRYPDIF